jgi:hypothetical protein
MSLAESLIEQIVPLLLSDGRAEIARQGNEVGAEGVSVGWG